MIKLKKQFNIFKTSVHHKSFIYKIFLHLFRTISQVVSIHLEKDSQKYLSLFSIILTYCQHILIELYINLTKDILLQEV